MVRTGPSRTGRPVCGYATDVRLLAEAWPGHIEVLHEPDYPEQRIIPMKYRPHRAAVLDYGALWAIDPAFSNFKSCGLDL